MKRVQLAAARRLEIELAGAILAGLLLWFGYRLF
jgi:hypothetical protein